MHARWHMTLLCENVRIAAIARYLIRTAHCNIHLLLTATTAKQNWITGNADGHSARNDFAANTLDKAVHHILPACHTIVMMASRLGRSLGLLKRRRGVATLATEDVLMLTSRVNDLTLSDYQEFKNLCVSISRITSCASSLDTEQTRHLLKVCMNSTACTFVVHNWRCRSLLCRCPRCST